MNIISIKIKNVRGIKDKVINLNMLPNKPSLLVAPNGSGKSSFAFAFQWLNRQKMKLDIDDAYDGNVNNKPELTIITDEPINNEYVANEEHNSVSKRFGIFVINNGLKTSTPGVHNGVLAKKARITVPEIVLLEGMPQNVSLEDDFEETYEIQDAPVGLYPSINALLGDNRFMASLDYSSLKVTARPMAKILKIVEKIKLYEGTVAIRHDKILTDNKDELEAFTQIQYTKELVQKFCPSDSEVKLLLKALKIVSLSYRKKDEVKQRIEYSQYKLNEEGCKKLFDSLETTWKDIKPHRENGKVVLRLGDVQRISNGERDILILLGKLQEARIKITKQDNILVIDEVFDYLDDANLVAAQHYVNLFIKELKKEGKNIYPIILSHINPSYYRTFAFQDMKVYYLNPLQYPRASDNMMKLVRKRDELERSNKDNADLISKYMLHFHTDYTRQMQDVINMTEPNWGDISTFKQYCMKQVTEYLTGNKYDSLGVCVALREMIEKYCYNQLDSEDCKEKFLNEHGTENKIAFVESFNKVLPETFSLLGLVYNDPLHPNSKNNIDLRQTLYSRLENNTIKSMIREIKAMYERL